MYIRQSAPLALWMAGLLTGCSDKPGIVHMTVSPEAETINTDQPICLKVSLTSDERVCLAENYDVDVVLTKIGVEEKPIRSHGRFLPCLNADATTQRPFAFIAGLMDIADLQDRFVILNPGENRTNNLEIGGGELAVDWFDHRPQNLRPVRPKHGGWSPGDYCIAVELQIHDFKPPAPLFWRPYSHPLKFEIIVHIVGMSKQSAVIESPVQASEGN